MRRVRAFAAVVAIAASPPLGFCSASGPARSVAFFCGRALHRSSAPSRWNSRLAAVGEATVPRRWWPSVGMTVMRRSEGPRRLLASHAAAANGQEVKKWRFSAVLLFLPCMATFGLGTWQLFRRQWKIEVLDYRRMRLEEEPVQLVSAIASAHGAQSESIGQPSRDDLEFRTVVCDGWYDESRNLYVGPRARSAFGVTQKGYFVITPLLISDDDQRGGGERIDLRRQLRGSVQIPVLVNRGWVPSSWLEESASKEALKHTVTPPDSVISKEKVRKGHPWWKFWTRQQNHPDDEGLGGVPSAPQKVTVRGVIRGSEQPNMFVPLNAPDAGQWFYVDVPAMAQSVGWPDSTILIEVMLEGQKNEGRETFPVAKDPEALLHSSVMPQDHINYAITWYSLSAATTFMAVKRLRGPKRL